MADRLDIRTVMNCEASINVLSNALMEPYQMKIISHMKKDKEDLSKFTKKVTISAATEQLRLKMGGIIPLAADSHDPDISKRIDSFLCQFIKDELSEPEVDFSS